jgi:hypothetical protein
MEMTLYIRPIRIKVPQNGQLLADTPRSDTA